jgi:hypothetical protein
MLDLTRTRIRRTMAVAVCVAVASTGAVLAEGAQRLASAKTPSARVQIDGSGSVQLLGSLVVFGEVNGPAELVVQDDIGGSRVTIGTRAVKLRKAERRRFAGVSGRIYIEGRRLQVQFLGAAKVRLSVAAIGRAMFISGSGSYQLNASPVAAWPGPGVIVDLTPTSTAARAVARPATPAVVRPPATPAVAKPVPTPAPKPPAPVTTSPPPATTTATTTTSTAPIAGPALVTTTGATRTSTTTATKTTS